MSASHKGKPMAAATRAKLTGRKLSAETRAKMSASHTGKVCSAETRAKISATKKAAKVN